LLVQLFIYQIYRPYALTTNLSLALLKTEVK